MQKQDIVALATLARIELSETEIAAFSMELPAILEYVGAVQSMVAETEAVNPDLGPRYNVFRTDVISVTPEAHTADILGQMPEARDRYMVVKKILNVGD